MLDLGTNPRRIGGACKVQGPPALLMQKAQPKGLYTETRNRLTFPACLWGTGQASSPPACMSTIAPSSPAVAPRPLQGSFSFALVLAVGLATTALTLLGVYVVDVKTEDFHIMGWYADYVIPAGAMLVGLAASSGYGIASWLTGIKITRHLLWVVVIFQFFAYFTAQYIEFKNLRLIHRDGTPVGFFEYFDFAARSFAWKQKDGRPGEPLGSWGYVFRGLEVIGFVGGGLIVPVLLRKAPYCKTCRRYMRTKSLGFLPASVPARKIKKSDTEGMAAYQAEQAKALEAGQKFLETLRQLAIEGQSQDFQAALSGLNAQKKDTLKLPTRFSLHLVHCSRCAAGWLRVNLMTGQGRETKQSEVARADVSPDFVQTLRAQA
jgi:hypothetical protein